MKITPDIPIQAAESQVKDISKLVDAAHQFEASMLQELLKPMENNVDSWGGEDSGADNSFDAIRSFGTEAVARVVSDRGGFGIAKQVVSQITAEHQRKSENIIQAKGM
jgi:peptidoglycan hydrolase FlgJ